jgi:hypothetical protein
MNRLFFFICFGFYLGLSPLLADSLLLNGQDDLHIVLNNRVLARVNGKAITVLDVMKKMDMHFLKQFPEYASTPQARYQYYQVNWRASLQELIDKELILADAQEIKIPVSSGDVRKEMELQFGPNIISNLDKIGLSFEEAFKIVQGDLLIRRMVSFRIQNKALQSVTPQVIRDAYEEFAKTNIKQETWHYRVITIRHNDAAKGSETAQLAYRLLSEEKIPIDQLSKTLQERGASPKGCTASELFYHTENDVADVLKASLKELEPDQYSKPFSQKSRSDKSTIFRIVYLKEKVPAGAIPYNEMENQLKEELLDQAIAKESQAYLKKLHQHHAVPNEINELIPEDFQPFLLR